MRRLLLFVIIALLAPSAAASAAAPPQIVVAAPTIAFPDRITFAATVTADQPVTRITIEYGVRQLTCGTVSARAFPSFTPGKRAEASWTWEMRRSGSVPPGATIWYRWVVTAADGSQTRSPEQTLLWLDKDHAWRSRTAAGITLHWYEGTDRFGKELLDSAVTSLAALKKTTGVAPDAPVDVYIYASTDDMRAAVLYEPGWTGGLAYAPFHSVIIGIGPDDLAWGKRTIAHELTHVLVGQLTFSCIVNIPTWLNEGIAVYGEGGPEASSLAEFKAAVAQDRLLPVRTLSGNFSQDPGRADLSYSQSFSLVNYLVRSGGTAKLLALFAKLRDGVSIDPALQAVYGYDLDTFEASWRESIGAKPRAGGRPIATPRPSPVPTYVPLAP